MMRRAIPEHGPPGRQPVGTRGSGGAPGVIRLLYLMFPTFPLPRPIRQRGTGSLPVLPIFFDNEVVNAFGETAYAKVSMTGEQQLYLLDAELESSSIKDFSNLYAIAVPIQNPEKNEIKKTETVSVRIFK